MKKFLLFGLMAAILPAVAEEAADRKTATSLKYVEHELSTRQNKFTAEQNKAMEYTDSAGDVQKRAVTSNLGTSTSDTSLPMVGGVNTKLNQKQDDIAAVNDHTAVTYTGQPGGIGRKGIYQTTESYADQSDNLIDAKTFNAALKNGLDSEFKCREDNLDPNTNLCWLYTIHNTVGNELPDGYTELEYIRADGHQYIDTGVKASNKTKVEGDFYINTNFVGQVFGSYDSGKNFRMYVPSGSVNSASVFGPTAFTPQIIPQSFARETKISIRLDDTGIYIGDNVFTYTNTPSAFNATSNIWLGAISVYNNTNYLQGRIYNFSIWENGSLVRNFVPAQHGTAVGMYDTVSRQFFPSIPSNTNFIAGPALNVYIPQNQ